MNQVLRAAFQIAAFLLFQTVLLNLVGQSKYGKYIRTFSGFLLILLLCSMLRSLWDGTDLLAEVERQVEFVTEEGDFRLQLRQAEESQQQQLKQGYEDRILEEARRYLEENRYFLAGGSVSFTSEWNLEELQLTISRTWEGESTRDDTVTEIWIEPVEAVEPVNLTKETKIEREQAEQRGETDEEGSTELDSELTALRGHLAQYLGIESKQIQLKWKEGNR